MMEFAKIYVRSIVAIISMTVAVCYLAPSDPIILGGYMTAVVGCVLLDKGTEIAQ